MGRAIQDILDNLVGLTEIPKIVWRAGGEFAMGQEEGRDEERPVHRVSPFGLGEV